MSSDTNTISLKLVPIVGLAFASTSLSWALFNNIVPIFLKETYGIKLALVGFIMTWDNIIAFFIQPWIGSKSDTTKTKYGRRMPFIIPGIILGSIFFFGIYLASSQILFIFLVSIVVFNLSMAIYRSPAVSLMPDLISSKDRTIGNGIVNLMGGIFSGASLFVGGSMLKSGNTAGAFIMVSVGMIVSLLILVAIIKEPVPKDVKKEKGESTLTVLKNEIKRIFQDDDKSLLFMLFAIFSWFVAWNALEAFYSTYVHNVFLPNLDGEVAAGYASDVMFIFPVTFVLVTLIGGFLGKKLGRKNTMKIGLIIMTLSIFLGSLVNENDFLGSSMGWETSFKIIFAFAGIGWGLVNINSIVVVWELSIDNGTGTGMYYAFASAAAIIGPTVAGILMDIQVTLLFPFSITFLIVAILILFLVKTGETGDGVLIDEAMAEMVD